MKVKNNKKTLLVAEGLCSYLNEEEYEFLIKNVYKTLKNFNQGAFLCHEGNINKGFFGKLLIILRNIIAKTKSYKHFNNPKEISDYFTNKNFKKVEIINDKIINNMIYLVKK